MDGKAARLRNCKTNLARTLFSRVNEENRKEKKSTFSSNSVSKIYIYILFSRKINCLITKIRRKFSTVRNIFQTPRHRCIGDERNERNIYIVDTRCNDEAAMIRIYCRRVPKIHSGFVEVRREF